MRILLQYKAEIFEDGGKVFARVVKRVNGRDVEGYPKFKEIKDARNLDMYFYQK